MKKETGKKMTDGSDVLLGELWFTDGSSHVVSLPVEVWQKDGPLYLSSIPKLGFTDDWLHKTRNQFNRNHLLQRASRTLWGYVCKYLLFFKADRRNGVDPSSSLVDNGDGDFVSCFHIDDIANSVIDRPAGFAPDHRPAGALLSTVRSRAGF